MVHYLVKTKATTLEQVKSFTGLRLSLQSTTFFATESNTFSQSKEMMKFLINNQRIEPVDTSIKNINDEYHERMS